MKFDRIVLFSLAVVLATGAAQAARLQSATGIDTTDLATGGTVTGSVCAAAYPVTSLFDDDVSNSAGRWLATYSAGNMYAVYTFATPTVVDAYKLMNSAVSSSSETTRPPKAFRLRGSNDFDGTNYDTATWVELDEEYETAWTKGESRYFRFANTTAYTSYALHVETVNGATDYCQLQEMELYNTGLGETYVTTTVQTKVGDGAAEIISTIQSFPYAYVSIPIPAAPRNGLEFHRWSGASTSYAPLTIYPSADITLVANFYDTASATPIIAYVVPGGAGAKDGTSWENAYASVATAYNAVGANPGGGEVWVKTGRYSLGGKITMLPRVTVRGGFAGTETSADEADPDANPTFFGMTTTTDNVWPGTDPASACSRATTT